MSSYSNMAQLYDKLMSDVDYHKWYEYIKEIQIRSNKKTKNILEMACGTGSLTEILCENDFSVTCFDLSEEMLVIAYEKLRKYKNVTILNQNMVNFNLNQKFDIIISICDSINYITSHKELVSTFKNVYKHMNEEGIFIFDINSRHKLENIIAKNVFINDYDDIYYTWESEHDKKGDTVNFYLTFFVKDEDLYERFDEVHTQKIYDISDIVNSLKEAGFNKIEVFEAFTFDKPKVDSQRFNFIARKT
ncbi:class I SAM-dependent methyltransferase [Clostridiaceae bacterium M8S5]|nr:class I SAM-dependent methyltransferase [Clostridiaceae bacterium M8S5]